MENDFEKLPNKAETSGEQYLPPEQDFAKAFAEEGVPEFSGFGVKKDESNEYYGDLTSEELEQVAPTNQAEQANLGQMSPEQIPAEKTSPEGSRYDQALTDASAIVGYGFDAVARQNGVEDVVEKIKHFDETSSNNPIVDLHAEMGIDTPEEVKKINEESLATKDKREELIQENNMPEVKEKNEDNARQAIRDMKRVITEVEKVGPQYEDLRQDALKAGEGEFDYVVRGSKTQGLTEMFAGLSDQKERSNEAQSIPTEASPDQVPPDVINYQEVIDNQEKEERLTA